MTALRTKLKKAFLLLTSAGLLVLVFIGDLIRRSLDIEMGWLGVIRDVLLIVAFVLFYLLIESMWKREQSPVKKLGFGLVLSIVIGIAMLVLSFIPNSDFDIKGYSLIPLGFDVVVLANILGIVVGALMIIIFLSVRDIILSKRRKGTRRNFLLLTALLLVTSLTSFAAEPLDTSILTSILFALTITAMLMNAFRLSWIVYLTKREKMFTMLFGFILFCIFIGFDIMLLSSSMVGKSLLFYSPPLKSFCSSISVFSTIYFGMTFLSTLFHLPTAEAFDRKMTEVTSLHNLSRLVTQVFDFNELVESVTRMTLDVVQAKSSWLEIIKESSTRTISLSGIHDNNIETVGLKNISHSEVTEIVSANGSSLRDTVLQTRKALVIDDVENDKRTEHLSDIKHKIGSLVIVPLQSHDNFIGILYATKDIAYGFDKDDVDVITAFADQATIAIDNSRLIEKSLERERLLREMMVAQEMQKKLLPQILPDFKEVEIEALSTPAFEVGGDYYDYTMLDEHHLGIIVGDVSGKGVSAAFYMAEMKGIFQSLSKIYRSPKEFLIKAHAALAETIDKRWFISVIYIVLDLRTGKLQVARAGHCPMLYIAENNVRFVQPKGLGLGMGSPDFFALTLAEEEIQMQPGDVAVLFTDGITEARQSSGEEFGYDPLLEIGKTVRNNNAIEIRDAIITAVDTHMGHQPPEDDLTLVVLKWRKPSTIL